MAPRLPETGGAARLAAVAPRPSDVAPGWPNSLAPRKPSPSKRHRARGAAHAAPAAPGRLVVGLDDHAAGALQAGALRGDVTRRRDAFVHEPLGETRVQAPRDRILGDPDRRRERAHLELAFPAGLVRPHHADL